MENKFLPNKYIRRDTAQPANELQPLVKGEIELTELPYEFGDVVVLSEDKTIRYSQVEENEDLKENNFRINYDYCKISMHPSLNGKSFWISYMGMGKILIPYDRIYKYGKDGNTIETLQESVDNAIAEIPDLKKATNDCINATNNANKAINNANSTNAGLNSTINQANETKSNLDDSNDIANNTKSDLDDLNQEANNTINEATSINNSLNATINTANMSKKNLDSSINTGNTLNDGLKNNIRTGQFLLSNLKIANSEVNKKIDNHINDDVRHITNEERNRWNNNIAQLAGIIDKLIANSPIVTENGDYIVNDNGDILVV
jgi:uncharacterized phage infection (PIP) family protein YhgE